MSFAHALSFNQSAYSSGSDNLTQTNVPVLQVLAGRHSGASIPFDGADCVVGASRESDVILSDASVVDRHVKLRVCGRMLTVDAIGGDVAVKGHSLLTIGRGCKVRMPAEIRLGDACFSVQCDPAPMSRLRRISLWVGAVLAVVIVPLAVAKTNFSKSFEAEAVANSAYLASSDVEPPRSSGYDPVITSSVKRDLPKVLNTDVLSALRQKIGSAGISTVSVALDDRHITASGVIGSDRKTAWGQIQEWFDRTYGSEYVLTSAVGAAAVARTPSFNFQAAWFGDDPYVIGGDGVRLYPGAAISDGWSIKSIEKGRILVTRRGEEFALTL